MTNFDPGSPVHSATGTAERVLAKGSTAAGSLAILAILTLLLLSPREAAAQSLLSLQSSQGAAGTTWSVPIQTLLIFTALSFLPAVLLLMTSFTRIIIVLSLVRQALGLQSAPPNQVIVGMSLFLTAFVISELKTAFQIGFMVFIPFILIDLICASVLMSLGMMMVSPVLVALPFKLVLFVLADGWNLLVGSLVASFSP